MGQKAQSGSQTHHHTRRKGHGSEQHEEAVRGYSPEAVKLRTKWLSVQYCISVAVHQTLCAFQATPMGKAKTVDRHRNNRFLAVGCVTGMNARKGQQSMNLVSSCHVRMPGPCWAGREGNSARYPPPWSTCILSGQA